MLPLQGLRYLFHPPRSFFQIEVSRLMSILMTSTSAALRRVIKKTLINNICVAFGSMLTPGNCLEKFLQFTWHYLLPWSERERERDRPKVALLASCLRQNQNSHYPDFQPVALTATPNWLSSGKINGIWEIVLF